MYDDIIDFLHDLQYSEHLTCDSREKNREGMEESIIKQNNNNKLISDVVRRRGLERTLWLVNSSAHELTERSAKTENKKRLFATWTENLRSSRFLNHCNAKMSFSKSTSKRFVEPGKSYLSEDHLFRRSSLVCWLVILRWPRRPLNYSTVYFYHQYRAHRSFSDLRLGLESSPSKDLRADECI